MNEEQARALLTEIQHERDRRGCRQGPHDFMRHVTCLDTETGEDFRFHLDDPASGWHWQREQLDFWLNNPLTVTLKARQLGVTWLAAALELWHLLYRPGTRCLTVSINQKEAVKVIRRIWRMHETLPPHLRRHAEVVKPARGEPSEEITVRHPDGRQSSIIALPSTQTAGHGETAAFVVLDELARQEYAEDTWAAVLPTAAKGGRIAGISTGNGVSNGPGQGSFFHYLWSSQDTLGVKGRFLPWDLHPDRDEAWYRQYAMALPPARRGEQYPRNEREAFILTGDPYIDVEALAWYEENALRDPQTTGDFQPLTSTKAELVERPNGWIRVLDPPTAGHSYAVAADVATGRGKDYSAAYVIDLANMALCAELHGKIPADRYAQQLHYLGRWYNTALLAVETGGGYGEAPIVFLRDGRDGRPPYPKLYRHRQFSRGDQPEHKPYGFPMNTKTRPLALEGMSRAVREHSPPWLTRPLVRELSTFVHRDTNPSPRAQDGCNDDLVMAFAIACELYRQHGEHPDRHRPHKPRGYRPNYPWQPAAA